VCAEIQRGQQKCGWMNINTFTMLLYHLLKLSKLAGMMQFVTIFISDVAYTHLVCGVDFIGKNHASWQAAFFFYE